jgi:hypothetical protein
MILAAHVSIRDRQRPIERARALLNRYGLAIDARVLPWVFLRGDHSGIVGLITNALSSASLSPSKRQTSQ